MIAWLILYSALILLSTFYFVIILLIDIGLFRFKPIIKSENIPTTIVSIIIAVRNEESTIENCLNDINSQKYPFDLFEVVVVDDHSDDRTKQLVSTFAENHPSLDLKLITSGDSDNDQAYKKRAIRSGIASSKGELILTTDADTRLNPRWISSFVSYYEKHHPEMIIGPVMFHEENTLFEHIQGLEFMGLMAATAGSCKMKFPLMCNGANLAFTRKAYLETLGMDDDLRHPSGDDLFLMIKIGKQFRSKTIQYLFAKEAVVYTKAKRSLHDFFSQRLRWVSKSKGYSDKRIICVSVITWLFNFILFMTLIAGIFNLHLLIYSLILLAIKMIFEFPAVYRMKFLFGNRMWILFPLTQLLNLVYVSLIGIMGNVLPYKWKGRKISPVNRNQG